MPALPPLLAALPPPPPVLEPPVPAWPAAVAVPAVATLPAAALLPPVAWLPPVSVGPLPLADAPLELTLPACPAEPPSPPADGESAQAAAPSVATAASHATVVFLRLTSPRVVLVVNRSLLGGWRQLRRGAQNRAVPRWIRRAGTGRTYYRCVETNLQGKATDAREHGLAVACRRP